MKAGFTLSANAAVFPPARGGGGLKYAETMVMYEMGKFPPFQKLFGKEGCPATRYGVYDPHNGDRVITEDLYGDALRERSVEDTISFLEGVAESGGDASKYERVAPLLALLREYRKIQNSWYDLAVLHYGG